MVAYLHTTYHVTYRACGVLLWSLKTVFKMASLLPDNDNMPTTLGTTFNRLGLQESFQMFILCPNCKHPAGIHKVPLPKNITLECSLCNTWLYKNVRPSTFSRFLRMTGTLQPKPALVAPYTSLRQLLTEFLSRPGMEDIIDCWRENPYQTGKYTGIWDGKVWRNLKDETGQPFFTQCDNNELRIGLTAGYDK